MSEPTKGEWLVKEEVDGHYSVYSDATEEDTICVVWDNLANAQLIVRARNSHDDLLAACEMNEKMLNE